jgi:hypothetical protein
MINDNKINVPFLIVMTVIEKNLNL